MQKNPCYNNLLACNNGKRSISVLVHKRLTLLVAALVALFACCLASPQAAHADSGWLDSDAYNGTKVYYDKTYRMFTTYFWVDGHVAYCCQPANSTPNSGNYWKNYWNNPTVAAILYYGYGGPGWDYAKSNGWWPSYNSDGDWMSDADYYVATHILVSWAYGSDALYGTSWYFRNWCNNELFGWVINNLNNNAWRVPQAFRNNVYWMDTGWNTPYGWQGQDVVSYNWVNAGGIQINKKEAKTNRNLGGINFGIYNSDEYGNWGARVTTITTDGAGNAQTRDNELPTGWYRLWEDNPPAGCDNLSSDPIYITDNFSYAHYTAKNGVINWNKDWSRIQLYNTVYTTFQVHKKWNGTKIPKSTSITLYRNGVQIDTISLDRNSSNRNDEGNWYYTWSKLQKYDDNGKAYTYTAKENGIDDEGNVELEGTKYSVAQSGSGGNDITNTQLKDITVNKKWVDSDNTYNTRPKSIKIELERYCPQAGEVNGTIVDELTLDDTNNWSGKWTNLPTVNNKNQPYTYVPVEKTDAKTTQSYSSARTGGDTSIFTNTLKTTEVNVNKTWIGNESKPTGVVVHLVNQDGKEYSKATLTAKDNWSYTFKNLPIYNESGTKNTWTINEESVARYKQAPITSTTDQATTMTTINIKNVSMTKRDIPVTKTWNDTNAPAGSRPASVTVQLYRDGIDTGQSLTLTATNNWRGSFKNCDVYDNDGNAYNYTVKELPVTGYASSIKGSAVTGYTINNQYGVTTFKVTKRWNDNNDAAKKRPSSITVRAYADGTATDKTLTITKSGAWSGTFTNLPKYNSSGKEINYTINEDAVTLYTPTVSGDYKTGFTVTNKYVEDKTVASINKAWDDDDDARGVRPKSASFNLVAKKMKTNDAHIRQSWNGLNGTGVPTILTEEKYNVTDKKLAARIIDENKEPVTDSFSTTASQFARSTPYLYDVKESKIVYADDNGCYTIDLTGKYNVFVLGYMTNIEFYLDKGPMYRYNGDKVDVAWPRINGLPYYNPRFYLSNIPNNFCDVPTSIIIDKATKDAFMGMGYTTTKSSNGGQNTYTKLISEKRFENHNQLNNTEYPTEFNIIDDISSWGKTSSNICKIKATGKATKDSKGNDAHEITIFQDSGVKYLVGDRSNYLSFYYENNTNNTQKVSIVGSCIEGNFGLGLTVQEEVHRGEKVIATFDAKPGVHFYQLNNIASASSSDHGYGELFYFKNEKGDITNNFVSRFCTYVNTSMTEIPNTTKKITVNKETNWKQTIQDLPKFSDNNEVIYYSFVELESNKNYVPNISPNKKYNNTGYNIDYAYDYNAVNTFGDATRISVSKTWNDENNLNLKRPSSITVNLLVGNKKIQSKVVTGTGNTWSCSFDDLPVYDSNGKKIYYSVSEDTVPYYSLSVENPSTYQFNLVNTYTTVSATAVKKWVDDNDATGQRPDNVVFMLQCNGEDTGRTLVLNAGNEWRGSISGLPARDENGIPLSYMFREVTSLPAYTSSVDYDTGNSVDANGAWNGTTTVTNTLAKRDVSVSKKWDLLTNSNASVPASLTVTLYADGVAKQTATLSESNNWSYKFSGLDYKNGSGKVINYTVDESSFSGSDKFTKRISGDASSGYVIMNSEKVNIPVTKVWDDDNDIDGIRPASVSVKLYADGTATSKTLTLNAGNSWSGSFSGLDKRNAEGNDINYTVREDNVPSGYKASVSGSAETGYQVVNSHERQYCSVNVVKRWDDNDNQDKVRPGNIVVRLYRDGSIVPGKTATLNDANGWKYSFGKLPWKDASGKEYAYTVQEDAVSGYAAVYTTSEDGSLVITNKHESKTRDIPVIKRWVNADNVNKPNKVVVGLYQNGKKLRTIDLTAAGNWEGKFTGLPIYPDGSSDMYQYTIKEEGNDAGWGVKIGGDMEHGFVITNIGLSATINLNGIKEWLGDTPDQRPSSITVRLYRNDVEIKHTTVTANDNGAWRFGFSNLDVADADGNPYVYTVREDDVPGYVAEYGYMNDGDTYRITNRKTKSVTVAKKWDDDNNARGSRPTSIKASLIAKKYSNEMGLVYSDSDKGYPFNAQASGRDFTILASFDGTVKTAKITQIDSTGATRGGTTISVNGDTAGHLASIGKIADNGTIIKVTDTSGKDISSHVTKLLIRDDSQTSNVALTVELNEGNNWTWTFDNLKVNDNKGFPFEYTVDEENVYGYTGTVSGNELDGYTLTNKEQRSIKFVKKWVDANGQAARPNNVTATIDLMQNGKKFQSKTVSSANNWAGEFSNIPWRDANGNIYEYTVQEEPVDGWCMLSVSGNASDGFIVTNGKTTSMNVTKRWVGDSNNTGTRPADIAVALKRNVNLTVGGSAMELSDVSEKLKASMLSCCDNYGVPSKVSVNVKCLSTTERNTVKLVLTDGQKDYSQKFVKVDSNSNETVDFDLSGITEHKLFVTVTPVSNNDTLLDEQFADGSIVLTSNISWCSDIQEKKINNASGWKTSFDSLPVIDSTGALIDYEVYEKNVPSGYAVSYSNNGDNWIITNTYDKINIPIQKVWNDLDNKDNKRPQYVEVELLMNGAATGKKLKLSSENDWHAEFTSLDKKHNGKDVVYSVRENNVPDGYTVSVSGTQSDGFIVTNTHNVKTSVTVVKQWDDHSNASGKRPGGITLHLFANGIEIASARVENDGNGNWEKTFDNLDYADSNGKLITYTVSEDGVAGYKLIDVKGDQNNGYTLVNWTQSPVLLPNTGLGGYAGIIAGGIFIMWLGSLFIRRGHRRVHEIR